MTTACINAPLHCRHTWVRHVVASYGSKSKYINVKSDYGEEFLILLLVKFMTREHDWKGVLVSVFLKEGPLITLANITFLGEKRLIDWILLSPPY